MRPKFHVMWLRFHLKLMLITGLYLVNRVCIIFLIQYLSTIIIFVLVLEVQYAIPMIMGSNIGTSLTNTLVSFSQVAER